MKMVLNSISKKIRFLQVTLDFVLIAIAWGASYVFRFIFFNGQPGANQVFLEWFFPLVVLTLYFLMRNRLYDQKIHPPFAVDAMVVMKANTTSILFFIVLLYFASDTRLSRLTLILYGIVSTVCLLFGRAAFRSFVRKVRRRGFALSRVFVIGSGPQTEKYLRTVDYTPGTGLKIAATFGLVGPLDLPGVKNFSLSELDSNLQTAPPDVVVLGFADEDEPFVGKFMQKYYDSLFTIQVLAAERQSLLGLTSETLADVHLLTLNQPAYSVTEIAAKRMIDFFASCIGLLVLSPLFILVGLLIKCTSEGAVFYSQDRVGLDGRTFKMWKFRSMKPSCTSSEPAGWTIENDPRRTRIGTFIRSTSIDELPQLWNVLIGDMSLVGPRPEQPFFVDKFRREIPAYMLRHKMRAGITGWAQVNGWRGDTSLHKRIECDLYYIRNWTFWFDVKILIMTFVKGFINKNAY